MFRSTGTFDKLLDKATSNLLMEPDWPSILQLCDLVRQDNVQPKYAMTALKKKLFSTNPHTALFALQVLDSLVKNCGGVFHEELTVNSNCQMLHELASTSQHEKVCRKLLELIQIWTLAFRKSPKHNALKDTMNFMKAIGYKFPTLRESDAMFSADSSPEWVDGEVCHRCRSAFGVMWHKHHCYNCGQVFCLLCSQKTTALPKFGIEKKERVCAACYDLVTKPSAVVKKAPSGKQDESDLPAEYLTSSLAQQNQSPLSKMSQMIKLDITQACYDGLRCSVCSGYLSLAPIRLLPDGSALCCHCVPPNNEVPYRAVIVESLLSNTIFPCRYKEFGCTTNVQFNNSLNHEDGCIHRHFPCASLPHTSCSWKGSASQVTGHFVEKHSSFVQQEAKIKLRIDQNKEGVLLVKVNPGSFLVKYAFNSTTYSLSYHIRLCMEDVDDQDCKLQLSNDLDLDNCLTLKAKCFAYNNNTDLCNANMLNLDMKSVLTLLNNPTNVTVLFHVKLQTPMTDSSPNNEID